MRQARRCEPLDRQCFVYLRAALSFKILSITVGEWRLTQPSSIPNPKPVVDLSIGMFN